MTALPQTPSHGSDAHAAHGPDAHGHGHTPHLAHHWENLQQQFDAGKLGMWLFLATEILLFGGLFCGYSVWRGNHPELFSYGSRFLEVKWGAINTVVLIVSSLTMAWGVTCAQKNQQLGLKICLVLTLLGATTFLGIKYIEYSHKIHEGWVPGLGFYNKPEHATTWRHGHADEPGATGGAVHGGESPAAAPVMAATSEAAALLAAQARPPADAPTIAPAAAGPGGIASAFLEGRPLDDHDHGQIIHPLQDPDRPRVVHKFFDIYFMMTGLHGVHVLVGMIVITWLLIRSFKGHFNGDYFTPVDLGGLYWHVVDLIWIFLFPLFYLIH